MASQRRLSKLLVFARTAAVQELSYRVTLTARLLFFVVLLLIFSNLWRKIFESTSLPAGDPDAMLWYLFATECIALSVPRLVTEVEDDVRSGNLAYFLNRPVTYPAAILSRGIGILVVRLVYFSVIGAGFTCLFTGSLPPAGGLWGQLSLAPLAAAVLCIFETSIGLAALWLQESTPIFWVWQKLLFILGGLMFPLTIYPEWLVTCASFTPFYAVLYGPARLMIEFKWSVWWESAALLVFWAAAGLALMYGLFRAAERTVTINGG